MSNPKGNTSKISDGNRAVIPKENLGHISAGHGDSVSFYNVPGPAVIMIKTDSMNISGFLKSLLAAVAVLAVFMALPSFAYAHAQEATQTIVTANGTQTTHLDTPIVAFQPLQDDIPSYGFLGPTAYFPFRVEITYPAGSSLIYNLTKNSPNTATSFSISDGQNGISTMMFSTGMADIFEIVLGQRYSVSVDQIATMTVYANNTVVGNYEIPIDGDHFQVKIKAVTTAPPHTPTADELNAGVYQRLDQLNSNYIKHNDESATTNRVMNLAANGFSFSIVPSFGSMVFNAMIAAAVIFIAWRTRGFKKTPVITVRSKEGQK